MLGLYDAENFYYCIAHNIASLTDQAFDVTFPEIIFCLKSIQEMKFYLRMVFGVSKGSYSRTILKPFLGIFQGKGGASVGWFLINFIPIFYSK